jgi:hypothetical protein
LTIPGPQAGHVEAERLCGLEVDHQLELRRLFDAQRPGDEIMLRSRETRK